MNNVPRFIKSPWRFEHYILKPSACLFLVLGMAFLIIKVWLEGAVFIAACSLTYAIAANMHWDAKTRTFPKDWPNEYLTGMDPDLTSYRLVSAILSFSFLVGIMTVVLLIRFHQEWYYTLLGGFGATLAAGLISTMVSIRPWPKK